MRAGARKQAPDSHKACLFAQVESAIMINIDLYSRRVSRVSPGMDGLPGDAATPPDRFVPRYVPGAMPRWSTAAFGEAPDSLPREASALGEHLNACRATSGRLFSLQCGAEAMHTFVSCRLVTTVTAVLVLVGLVLFVS
jgi:hypothetical protein